MCREGGKAAFSYPGRTRPSTGTEVTSSLHTPHLPGGPRHTQHPRLPLVLPQAHWAGPVPDLPSPGPMDAEILGPAGPEPTQMLWPPGLGREGSVMAGPRLGANQAASAASSCGIPGPEGGSILPGKVSILLPARPLSLALTRATAHHNQGGLHGAWWVGGTWDCLSAGSLAKRLQVAWPGSRLLVTLAGHAPPTQQAPCPQPGQGCGSMEGPWIGDWCQVGGSWALRVPATHLLHRGGKGVPKF